MITRREARDRAFDHSMSPARERRERATNTIPGTLPEKKRRRTGRTLDCSEGVARGGKHGRSFQVQDRGQDIHTEKVCSQNGVVLDREKAGTAAFSISGERRLVILSVVGERGRGKGRVASLLSNAEKEILRVLLGILTIFLKAEGGGKGRVVKEMGKPIACKGRSFRQRKKEEDFGGGREGAGCLFCQRNGTGGGKKKERGSSCRISGNGDRMISTISLNLKKGHWRFPRCGKGKERLCRYPWRDSHDGTSFLVDRKRGKGTISRRGVHGKKDGNQIRDATATQERVPPPWGSPILRRFSPSSWGEKRKDAPKLKEWSTVAGSIVSL